MTALEEAIEEVERGAILLEPIDAIVIDEALGELQDHTESESKPWAEAAERAQAKLPPVGRSVKEPIVKKLNET
jgi:hypothetical protein